MRLFDTHAHLDATAFEKDRDAVLQRAADAGVRTIITVGTSLSSSRRAVALSERFPQVYATVGVHPHEAGSVTREVLTQLRELASHPRVVAVGEIGLDFYRDLSPRDAQRFAFGEQLALAAKVAKPVVIHIRDGRQSAEAYDEAMEFLRGWIAASLETESQAGPSPWVASTQRMRRPPTGVLHCFSGGAQTMEAAVGLGLFVGVDGPITYPKATELRSVIARTPLDRLLLETDCPYLPPQPWRGRRNEPAYLADIVRKVAELKETSAECVASVTTENALHLFDCHGE